MPDGLDLVFDEKVFDNIGRAFEAIGNEGFKIVAREVHVAMRPMRSTARALVPKRHGLLKKAIGLVRKTYKRNGAVWVGLAVRAGFRATVTDTVTGRSYVADPTKYYHLVERGTAPHSIKRRSLLARGAVGLFGGTVSSEGRHPGSRAHSFLRGSFDRNHARVARVILTKTGLGIVRKARELGFKAA